MTSSSYERRLTIEQETWVRGNSVSMLDLRDTPGVMTAGFTKIGIMRVLDEEV